MPGGPWHPRVGVLRSACPFPLVQVDAMATTSLFSPEELDALSAIEGGQGASSSVLPAASALDRARTCESFVKSVEGHLLRKNGLHGVEGEVHLWKRYAGMYDITISTGGAVTAKCKDLLKTGSSTMCDKPTALKLDEGGNPIFSNLFVHFRTVHGHLLRKADRGKDDALAVAPEMEVGAKAPSVAEVADMRAKMVVYQMAGGLSVNHMSSLAITYLLRSLGHPPIPRRTYRGIKAALRSKLIDVPIKNFIKDARRNISVIVGGIPLTFSLKLSDSTDGWTTQRGITLQSHVLHSSTLVMGSRGVELRPAQIPVGFTQLPVRSTVQRYEATSEMPKASDAIVDIPDDKYDKAADAAAIDAGATAHALDYSLNLERIGLKVKDMLRSGCDSAAVMVAFVRHVVLSLGGPWLPEGTPAGVMRAPCFAHANDNACKDACKTDMAKAIIELFNDFSLFFNASWSLRGKHLHDSQVREGGPRGCGYVH